MLIWKVWGNKLISDEKLTSCHPGGLYNRNNQNFGAFNWNQIPIIF